MTVEINHRVITVNEGCTTLGQLLANEGFTGVGQAVAVDHTVVPKAQWESFVIADGMKITVLRAVCGG